MKKSTRCPTWLLALSLLCAAPLTRADSRMSPDWLKDLVIYEIATKSFTSPNGPESGTFESLKARLPYLQELGITGIWLTGHSVSDSKHFYNIWTQYAAIEPDQLDPSLGTPEQFKAMIDEAHRCGIRVFLDVITHGVMPSSSLIKKHPHWFRGGSWGMTDYDWNGGHTDLDEWWEKLWTNYVTEYGVDGFRLDVDIYRPDLWSRIRQNAARAGRPITIFNELKPIVPGVTDFTQAENRAVNFLTGVPDPILANNLPRFYSQRLQNKAADFKVAITYENDSSSEGSTRQRGALQVHVRRFTQERISYTDKPPAGSVSELAVTISGVKAGEFKQIVVTRLMELGPGERKQEWKLDSRDPYSALAWDGTAPEITVYLKVQVPSPTIQLSSHDHGWEGFPSDGNPYSAEGSRALMAYAALFTPAIPIFMAGEEFDAGFHALPGLSPKLFGGRDPGKGRWLYGGQLDWSELSNPHRRAMFADTRRMLAIRKQEKAVLAAEVEGEFSPRLTAVPYQSNITVPVPYFRWSRGVGILVAANRNTDTDAYLRLNVPIDRLGVPATRYRVTDVWNGTRTRIYAAKALADFKYTVRRDKMPRGGIGVVKIEPVGAVRGREGSSSRL